MWKKLNSFIVKLNHEVFYIEARVCLIGFSNRSVYIALCLNSTFTNPILYNNPPPHIYLPSLSQSYPIHNNHPPPPHLYLPYLYQSYPIHNNHHTLIYTSPTFTNPTLFIIINPPLIYTSPTFTNPNQS